jgi:cytochrome c oxidase subunit I+III
MPYTSRHALSERVGRWVFGLMFVGFNVAFFPMHITGLAGMPRRIYTYQAGLGWDGLNMVSTVGAFMIAAGVLVFLIDVARRFRMSAEGNAGNVWNAGTLEWLPNGNYSSRSIPIVTSREPLWDQPGLAKEVEEGRYYLPGTATGGRETIITSAVDARPQWVLRMPMPGWAPLVAALFTAVFFFMLTFKLVLLAIPSGIIAIAALLHWGWCLDPPPNTPAVDIGGGLRLPLYATGPLSQAWWAMVLLMFVSASLYGCALFSYLYLWTVSPGLWPGPDSSPPLASGIVTAVLLAASSAAVAYANRGVQRNGNCAGLLFAVALLIAGSAVNLLGLSALSPQESAYAAIVYALVSIDAFFATVSMVLAVFAVARWFAGRLDRERRVTFDNARLFWHYTVAQTMAGLLMVYGFPRLVN